MAKLLHFTLEFSEASGDVVITMDSDLQDNPDEIPNLSDDSGRWI